MSAVIPRREETAARWLAVILLGSLALRLGLAFATASLPPRIVDEQHYVSLAHSLATGHGFNFPNGPTSLRPPLYPWLVSTIWRAVGAESLLAIRLVQAVLGVVTGLLAYRIGKDVFGEKAGLWAAGLTSAYPALVVAQVFVLTETLFALLVAATMAMVLSVLQRPRVASAIAAGVLLGAAALTRSILYLYPVVLVPLLVVWMRAPLARRLAVAAAFCAGYLAIVTPWAMRNTHLQRVPVIVDTMGGMNLRMGNYEFTPHDRMWDAVGQEGERSWIVGLPEHPPEGGTWTEGQKERWARGRAVAFMTAHPLLTAWRSSIKFGDFWALDRDFLAGVQRGLFAPPPVVTVIAGGLLAAAFPAALALAILGVWRVPSRDVHGKVILLLTVAFVCALHTIVFAHPRYRLPLMPLVLVFSGAAIASGAWRQFDLATWRDRAALVTLAAFAGLWVIQIAWRDWPAIAPLLSGRGV